jgi:diguanylate cyclase (GGDEF)-like protein
MAAQDRALQVLMQLGDPAERRTRAEAFDLALRTALTLLDADAIALTTKGKREERMVLHSGSASPAAISMPEDGSEVLRRFAENAEPIALAVVSDDIRIAAADGCPGVEPGPVLFTPVRRREASPAYIAAYRRRARARFTMAETRMMLLLAAWLGSVLDGLRLAAGIEKTAVTDPQTGVYGVHYLKAALRREVRRARRYDQELSLVLVDVDRLKVHGETLGAEQGGQLLKELATTLAQQVRSFDVLARCGDDAFMLILPQTGREGAAEVAERVRATVEQHAFASATAGAVTVSAGVASFPADASALQDLVAAVTRALKTAKQRGRNRVETPASRAA